VTSNGLIHGVRRAWALVDPTDRRRLRLVAAYGVLIAVLDTFALVLIYALINLLGNQHVGGVAASFMKALGVSTVDRYHAAFILLAVTSVLFVARSLLSVLGLWLTWGAANNTQANLISRLLVGHARAPQIVRLERNSADTLRTVFGSVDQVVFGVVASSVQLLSNVAVTVAVAVGLILASPLVALAVTIYFALIAFMWARGVRGALARRGSKMQSLFAERYQMMLQGISAAKELQLRGRALFYAEGAAARTRAINDAMRGATVLGGSLRYMLETSLVIGAVVVVGVAGLTTGKDAALPAVGLVLAGAFRLLPALNQVLFLNNSVHLSSPATDLVEEELSTFGSYGNEGAVSADAASPHKLERALELREVSFRYPSREQPALRSVSVTVRPGESFGIVGPTGSGKSTLLDVILGMLEPSHGQVLVDGRPLATLKDAWQRSVGYVPQDVYIVDDSVRANVALGWYGEEIDDARVGESIRMAGLEDVVTGLPDGLDTILGERGVRLSGGQRQRVGLARALYTSPSVLVLDEATSNLDQTTERRIVETLNALAGKLTMIVVTHRLVSVEECDNVVYLEHGQVKAEGRFSDLPSSLFEARDPSPEDAPLRLIGQERPIADAGR
jgi:ABC-type multidrug transport system fused ATPase/permease subunit